MKSINKQFGFLMFINRINNFCYRLSCCFKKNVIAFLNASYINYSSIKLVKHSFTSLTDQLSLSHTAASLPFLSKTNN
jgi:hypothetical protein